MRGPSLLLLSSKRSIEFIGFILALDLVLQLSRGRVDQSVSCCSLRWVSQDFAECTLEQRKEPFEDRYL